MDNVERKINFNEITPIIRFVNNMLGDLIIWDLKDDEVHFFEKIYDTCSDVEKRLIEINWHYVFEEINKFKNKKLNEV